MEKRGHDLETAVLSTFIEILVYLSTRYVYRVLCSPSHSLRVVDHHIRLTPTFSFIESSSMFPRWGKETRQNILSQPHVRLAGPKCQEVYNFGPKKHKVVQEMLYTPTLAIAQWRFESLCT